MARKLVEGSGLAGGTIALPVLVVLVAVQLAACGVVAALRGEGGMLSHTAAAGIIIWSVLACGKTILLQ